MIHVSSYTSRFKWPGREAFYRIYRKKFVVVPIYMSQLLTGSGRGAAFSHFYAKAWPRHQATYLYLDPGWDRTPSLDYLEVFYPWRRLLSKWHRLKNWYLKKKDYILANYYMLLCILEGAAVSRTKKYNLIQYTYIADHFYFYTEAKFMNKQFRWGFWA